MEKNKVTFKFQDLTPEEKERRGILARLTGPCASISIPTRNGRFYSESLWSRVFEDRKDNVTMEMFKEGGIPMELDHPADRLETCSDRIAAMMPEPPRKDENNQLVCCVDIIDTPCGKIAYQLAKYGFNLGISSRGNGETYTDTNGNESVDPDSYDFQTFDLVLLPALKEARLHMMTESLNGKTFKQAINECLDTASTEDRKIMTETLKELNIDYQDSKESNNINESAAKDNGADLVKTLQESLLAKETAEAKITELQEKLSVCYAKESEIEDKEQRYKDAVSRLTSSSNLSESLKKRVSLLSEKVKTKQDELNSKEETIKSLTEELNKVKQQRAGIKHLMEERVSEKDKEILSLRAGIKSLTESVNSEKQNADKEVSRLQENLEKERKDSANKLSEYDGRVSKYKALVEKYRTVAKAAVDKYIDCQANMLGVTSAEIKNRLNEGYSFNDIDRVCKDLQTYTVNMSKLPFNTIQEKSIRMKVTESKEPIKPVNGVDDEVDDSLKGLAGLN